MKKEAFLDYKMAIFKSQKISFFQGVNPWFGQKARILYIYIFLVNLRLEIMFNGALNKKEAFLDYENVSFFKSPKLHFSQGVKPWFWSKNSNFSFICFWLK